MLSCFTTSKPDKDVWGDNNGRMKDAFFVRITEADKKKFAGYVGEMRTLITDETIRVRSLYCTAANVKSYSRFFLDTNYVDAIPDEHGERRFFIIKCNEAKIGDADYFGALSATIADDRIIHAFFKFLKARTIKRMYLGKDIPIGEYQQELKDSRRSMAEQFLESFVQDQPIRTDLQNGGGGSAAPTEIELSIDDVWDKFRDWQKSGSEFERSKSSITRELALAQILGIKKIKPWEEVTVPDVVQEGCPQTFKVEMKQVPKYRFDLTKLRERYGISVEAAPTAAPPPAAVADCEADVSAWEEQVKSAAPSSAKDFGLPDDTDDEEEEAMHSETLAAEEEEELRRIEKEALQAEEFAHDEEQERLMEEEAAAPSLEGNVTGKKRPRTLSDVDEEEDAEYEDGEYEDGEYEDGEYEDGEDEDDEDEDSENEESMSGSGSEMEEEDDDDDDDDEMVDSEEEEKEDNGSDSDAEDSDDER